MVISPPIIPPPRNHITRSAVLLRIGALVNSVHSGTLSDGTGSLTEIHIGPPGFEPGTPSTPRKCATRLRYGPNELVIVS